MCGVGWGGVGLSGVVCVCGGGGGEGRKGGREGREGGGEGGGEEVCVVVVVRTWVVNGRSLSMNRHRMHLIRVAEHLGVKLPASPPPGTRRPAGRSAKNASK